MTVEAIKEEIGHLSEQERKQRLDWLEELEEQAWDRNGTRLQAGRSRRASDV